MRLAIYEEHDYALHGNQQYICLILKHLPEHGIKPVLIVRRKGALYEKARQLSKVLVIGQKCLPCRALALVSIMRDIRPDVILCNNERAFLVSALAARLAYIPQVWYIKDFRSGVLGIACFCLAKRVLTIASECLSAKRLASKFSYKSYVVSIGIPLSRFSSVMPPEGKGPLKILLIAALNRSKGVDLAIDAMENLDRIGANVILRVAGATPPGAESFAREMYSRGKKLLNNRLEWLGWQEDVVSLLSWSDVVILPSRSEGVPRSLVEAMAAARPVIATSVGGIPSLITDGETGFIIPVNDPITLANRIELLMNEPELRRKISMAARKHVVNNHSLSTHMQELTRHLYAVASKAKF
jgi:L-malate glycosyltransferase